VADEGAFLTAVASAYFLALNALAAYLFLRLVQVGEDLQSLHARVDRIFPRLEEAMGFGDLALQAERLKPRKEQRSP
jgi:hypothetical protein